MADALGFGNLVTLRNPRNPNDVRTLRGVDPEVDRLIRMGFERGAPMIAQSVPETASETSTQIIDDPERLAAEIQAARGIPPEGTRMAIRGQREPDPERLPPDTIETNRLTRILLGRTVAERRARLREATVQQREGQAALAQSRADVLEQQARALALQNFLSTARTAHAIARQARQLPEGEQRDEFVDRRAQELEAVAEGAGDKLRDLVALPQATDAEEDEFIQALEQELQTAIALEERTGVEGIADAAIEDLPDRLRERQNQRNLEVLNTKIPQVLEFLRQNRPEDLDSILQGGITPGELAQINPTLPGGPGGIRFSSGQLATIEDHAVDLERFNIKPSEQRVFELREGAKRRTAAAGRTPDVLLFADKEAPGDRSRQVTATEGSALAQSLIDSQKFILIRPGTVGEGTVNLRQPQSGETVTLRSSDPDFVERDRNLRAQGFVETTPLAQTTRSQTFVNPETLERKAAIVGSEEAQDLQAAGFVPATAADLQTVNLVLPGTQARVTVTRGSDAFRQLIGQGFVEERPGAGPPSLATVFDPSSGERRTFRGVDPALDRTLERGGVIDPRADTATVTLPSGETQTVLRSSPKFLDLLRQGAVEQRREVVGGPEEMIPRREREAAAAEARALVGQIGTFTQALEELRRVGPGAVGIRGYLTRRFVTPIANFFPELANQLSETISDASIQDVTKINVLANKIAVAAIPEVVGEQSKRITTFERQLAAEISQLTRADAPIESSIAGLQTLLALAIIRKDNLQDLGGLPVPDVFTRAGSFEFAIELGRLGIDDRQLASSILRAVRRNRRLLAEIQPEQQNVPRGTRPNGGAGQPEAAP